MTGTQLAAPGLPGLVVACYKISMYSRQAKQLWIIVALIAVVAIVAAGCGGDESDATTASGTGAAGTEGSSADERVENDESGSASGKESREGKAEFIAAADSVCAKAQARTAREFEEYSSGDKGSGDSSNFDQEVVSEVMIPRLEERVAGIQELETPPEAEKAAAVVIAGFERLRKLAETNPAKFQSQVTAVLTKAQDGASREGFDDCAGYLG